MAGNHTRCYKSHCRVRVRDRYIQCPCVVGISLYLVLMLKALKFVLITLMFVLATFGAHVTSFKNDSGPF